MVSGMSSTEPPSALTRFNGPPVFGANRMTPSAFQVPPRPLLAGASTCAGPPRRSIRFNWPPAKKPSVFPSGDQNGQVAPSVPASAEASTASTGRIQICETPLAPDATNASWRPSGDNASCAASTELWVPVNAPPAGGGTEAATGMLIGSAVRGRARNATASTAGTSSPASSRRGARDVRVEGADAPARPLDARAVHFNVAETSPSDCQRASGVLHRHRRTIPSTSLVVESGGNGGGSVVRIAAITVAELDPSKGRRRATIS